MDSLTNDVKHESERGEILKLLVEWGLEWMPLYEVRAQVASLTGRRLTDDQLRFHLNYLEQSGFAERKLLRSGRAGMELMTVRATSKAVDLVQGRLAPEAGIAL
ncbi:MAG TPA: hypothetical protein VG860_15820 [Terriglobia bacterium]|jgi:hypothetical protein|nr:hypothetical protein [Terriglobia bacterium]